MNAAIDVTNIRIETQRLILRPWQKTDIADLNAYASVAGVGEMAGWSHHKNLTESKAILEMFMREKKTFALQLKETGQVIGSLGLENLGLEPGDGSGSGREIGYVLSKDFWGRGLIPEAVSGVIDYCFRVLGYDFLTCAHFLWNNQSRRVIEKCGFRYFGQGSIKTQYNTVETTRYYVRYNPNK